MKKIFIGLLLMLGLSNYAILPVIAENTCNCSSSYIIDRLKNASGMELSDLFDKMIDNAAWYSSFNTEDSLAELIYAIRDESYFKQALKDYVTTNCSVSGNQIMCR